MLQAGRPEDFGSGGRRFIRKSTRYVEGRLRAATRRRFEARARRLFARVRISSVVVGVPAYRGVFEMKADSSLAQTVMSEGFEPEAPALIAALVSPGTDAVDVGANVGFFCVLMASLARPGGRVLAVEPSPAILPLLRNNLLRNNAANVVLHEGVLAERAGERTLNSVDASPEYSSMGAIVHPHAPAQITAVRVPSATLDDVVGRHALAPAFVKVDVEGAETLVLDGARDTLRRFRPAVLCEVDVRLLRTLGSTPAAVFRAFDSLDYRVFDSRDGRLCQGPAGDTFIGAVLALPAEQLLEPAT
jgi:FkbM family methyltransferase